MNTKLSPKLPVLLAILAVACYGVSSPVSKIFLKEIPPAFMAALLYLGAGLGMAAVNLLRNARSEKHKEAKMTKKELPYILGMIVLDIARNREKKAPMQMRIILH